MTTVEEEYNLNTLLSLTGRYQSQDYQWSIPVRYGNIEYDVTLNGGSVEIYFETSEDNFLTIDNTKIITLSDGRAIIDLSDLDYSEYLRFTITIQTIEDITPRIHRLDINGQAIWEIRETPFNMDLLTLTRDILIQNLTDALLLKRDISPSYIHTLLTIKLDESISSLVDTYLKLTTESTTNIDTILKLLGRYTSEYYNWGQIVDYANVEVYSTLYGCEVQLIVETSDDNFSTIKDTLSFYLSGGTEVLDISSLNYSAYVRYRLVLSSIYDNITPHIHKLVMNVQGISEEARTLPISIDMLTLNPDRTASLLLNVILSRYGTKKLQIDYDTLLSIVNDLSSNIDLLTKVTNELDIDIDVYLSKEIKNSNIIDSILSKIIKTSYKTNTLLSKFDTLDTYKDALVQFIKSPISTLSDTQLTLDDIELQNLLNVIIALSNDESFDFDTYLELTKSTSMNIDARVFKYGVKTLLEKLDIICKKNNISLSNLLDVVTILRYSIDFNIDTYLQLTSKESKVIDTLLQYNNISNLLNSIDIILNNRYNSISFLSDIITIISKSEEISMDVLTKIASFQSLNIDTILYSPIEINVLYNLDSIMRKLNITESQVIDIITIIITSTSFNIDSILKVCDKDTDTSYDTIIKIDNNLINYVMDLYLSLRTENRYILDVILKRLELSKYNIDTLGLKRDLNGNYGFDVILWLYSVFLDYAKQSPSSLYDMINTTSSIFGLTNSLSDLLICINLASSEMYLSNSISDVFAKTHLISSGLTATPSTTGMLSLTVTQEAVDKYD
jgi:hypothetical protein